MKANTEIMPIELDLSSKDRLVGVLDKKGTRDRGG